MAMWFYQMSDDWTPNEYRQTIWEGERWRWVTRKVVGSEEPKPGDIVVAFFTKAKHPTNTGFYGWAVILEWTRCVRPMLST